MIAVPVFAVIGGGDDGVFYVRQLRQAVAHGRLDCSRALVIDRRADCRVAEWLASSRTASAESSAGGSSWVPKVEVIVSDWSDWLADGLDSLPSGSQLVPWHWAPHLLLAWLQLHAGRAGGQLRREGSVPARSLPYDRETREGDRALSYATWACPPTCIEPAVCPHTRGPKDWSLVSELASPRPGEPFGGAIAFRCLHLVWGVGTIPVDEILQARDRLIAAGLERHLSRSGPSGSERLGSDPLAPGRSRWLVSTASHCHGLSASVILDRGPGLSR